MATFAGEDPEVVQMGWVELSDMKAGLKNSSDVRGAASNRREVSQKEITLLLTSFLY